MCVSKYICAMCVQMTLDTKRGLDPLDLELQVVVSCPLWVLGPERQSSGGVASAPSS